MDRKFVFLVSTLSNVVASITSQTPDTAPTKALVDAKASTPPADTAPTKALMDAKASTPPAAAPTSSQIPAPAKAPATAPLTIVSVTPVIATTPTPPIVIAPISAPPAKTPHTELASVTGQTPDAALAKAPVYSSNSHYSHYLVVTAPVSEPPAKTLASSPPARVLHFLERVSPMNHMVELEELIAINRARRHTPTLQSLPKGSVEPRPKPTAEPAATVPEFDTAGSSWLIAAADKRQRKPLAKGQKLKKRASSVVRTLRDESESDVLIRRVGEGPFVDSIPEEEATIPPFPTTGEGPSILAPHTGREEVLFPTPLRSIEFIDFSGDALPEEAPLKRPRRSGPSLDIEAEQRAESAPDTGATITTSPQPGGDQAATSEASTSTKAAGAVPASPTPAPRSDNLDAIFSDIPPATGETAGFGHLPIPRATRKAEARARISDELKNKFEEATKANDVLQAELESANQIQRVLLEERSELAAKLEKAEADLEESLKDMEAAEARTTILVEYEWWKSRRATLKQAQKGLGDLQARILEAKAIEEEAKKALDAESEDSE
ncbi:uncharacterized protein LOC132620055 [Lycium barbarum]|uniref:uncharacterized protein LOC132620055 n=1 Tax=Lycium barbarum TaxID=112863 RepID=UPI00293F0D15|nr:uncharacterized protein LOC132620055 [Lycium barbarum]